MLHFAQLDAVWSALQFIWMFFSVKIISLLLLRAVKPCLKMNKQKCTHGLPAHMDYLFLLMAFLAGIYHLSPFLFVPLRRTCD